MVGWLDFGFCIFGWCGCEGGLSVCCAFWLWFGLCVLVCVLFVWVLVLGVGGCCWVVFFFGGSLFGLGVGCLGGGLGVCVFLFGLFWLGAVSWWVFDRGFVVMKALGVFLGCFFYCLGGLFVLRCFCGFGAV